MAQKDVSEKAGQQEALVSEKAGQQEALVSEKAGQQEALVSEKAGQEDLQTQVIRRQIELAKDRNHLQRLVRQINHRTDAELSDTDVKLSMPPIQELLHNIRQLDETQYGILVKELSEVIKVQQLLDGAQKSWTAAEQEFPERISEIEQALPAARLFQKQALPAALPVRCLRPAVPVHTQNG